MTDYARMSAGAIVCALMLAVVAALAAQGDRARTEAQARRVSDRLQALQHEADSLATQERTLLIDLRRLEVERSLKTEIVKQAEADAAEASRQLGALGSRSMRSKARRRRRARHSRPAWWRSTSLAAAATSTCC